MCTSKPKSTPAAAPAPPPALATSLLLGADATGSRTGRRLNTSRDSLRSGGKTNAARAVSGRDKAARGKARRRINAGASGGGGLLRVASKLAMITGGRPRLSK